MTTLGVQWRCWTCPMLPVEFDATSLIMWVYRRKNKQKNTKHWMWSTTIPAFRSRHSGGIRWIDCAPRVVSTLMSKQKVHHYVYHVFESIFISKNLPLKFVPNGRIDNNVALVQMITSARTGDKPLSEPTMAKFSGAYKDRPASVR